MSSTILVRKYEGGADDSMLDCFVCKSSLKKVRSKNEIKLGLTDISSSELYECRKGHVFSREGLAHLKLYL